MAKKRTFADEAKTIMNKYKTRLGDKFDKGDTLALEAMNQELTGLREKQEETRINKLIAEGVLEENNQFGCGGKLKREMGGMLPMMEMEDGSFAYGGDLPMYQGDGVNSNYLTQGFGDYGGFSPYEDDPDPFADELYPEEGARGALGLSERYLSTPELTSSRLKGQTVQPEGLMIPEGETIGLEPGVLSPATRYKDAGGAGLGSGRADAGGEDEREPYTTRVPWWGAAAQGVGSMLMNRDIDFGDTGAVGAEQVVPKTVDYSRSREQIMRERDIANAMIRRGAKVGGSRSGYMQNVIGGATATGRTAGRQFSKSLEGEENINAQIRNRAGMFNAQQRGITGRLNAQRQRENLMINEQRRAGRIGGVTGAITGYGKDLMASSQYDQMLRMLEPDQFKLYSKEEQGKLLKFFGISDIAELGFKRGTATLAGKS